jgi:hypothetical protein
MPRYKQSIYMRENAITATCIDIRGVQQHKIGESKSLSEGESLGGLYECLREASNVHALHLWYVKLVTVEWEGPFCSLVRLRVVGIRHLCQRVTSKSFGR